MLYKEDALAAFLLREISQKRFHKLPQVVTRLVHTNISYPALLSSRLKPKFLRYVRLPWIRWQIEDEACFLRVFFISRTNIKKTFRKKLFQKRLQKGTLPDVEFGFSAFYDALMAVKLNSSTGIELQNFFKLKSNIFTKTLEIFSFFPSIVISFTSLRRFFMYNYIYVNR